VGADDTREELREEDVLRSEVEEAVAPLRERLDELEQTMLKAIVRLSSPPSTDSPPARWWSVAQMSDQTRRQLIVAVAGGVLLGVGMLSALLASCG
jgi:hypothetical protein